MSGFDKYLKLDNQQMYQTLWNIKSLWIMITDDMQNGRVPMNNYINEMTTYLSRLFLMDEVSQVNLGDQLLTDERRQRESRENETRRRLEAIAVENNTERNRLGELTQYRQQQENRRLREMLQQHDEVAQELGLGEIRGVQPGSVFNRMIEEGETRPANQPRRRNRRIRASERNQAIADRLGRELGLGVNFHHQDGFNGPIRNSGNGYIGIPIRRHENGEITEECINDIERANQMGRAMLCAGTRVGNIHDNNTSIVTSQ